MGPGMAWKPCASVRKGLRTEEKLVGGGGGGRAYAYASLSWIGL